MMRPALLLGLLAPTAALQLNRRDALKGTTASVAQIALTPTVATAAASEKLALPKMGIGAWAWGDSLFWSTRRPCAFDVT
tara:strand:+ start:454 stop:693 length:240 start_codon:yes stop_codon:yes gene_type:complete